MDTLKRIEAVAHDYVSDSDITAETSIRRDLGLDSLEFMQLVVDLEEEFGVSLPDKAFAEFQTIGDVVEYIDSYN